jgi:hypothetical protein
MYSGAGDTTQLMSGSPIRTPWDHSSVDSSPRPIAASHVLHRLLVPRHSPSALKNLTTKDARIHCTILNKQPPTPPMTQPDSHEPVLCPDAGDHPEQIRSHRTGLVLSGLNRVSTPTPAAPDVFPLHSRRSSCTRAGRCRRKLASVSADEHPGPQSGPAAPCPG